jgi:hypothetical protein
MTLTVLQLVAYGVSVFFLVHSPIKPEQADFLKLLDRGTMICLGFLAGGVASSRLTSRP